MRAVPILLVAVSLIGSTCIAGVNHAALDEILSQTVTDEGLVDYRKIANESWGDLLAYLDMLANTRDADALPRDDRLAFYINLYNATMIKAVIERDRENWSPAADDFAVFKAPLVNLPDRRTVSLNELEHEIIRPNFKDPRVHVALVCAARSCPPLLGRAYRGEDLDAVLDQNMRRFVNDPSRNVIDRTNRKLILSKVFEWYADDFGGKDAIAGYVSKYVEGGSVEGFAVSFMGYDWSLNRK
jgi:hypothetical protein